MGNALLAHHGIAVGAGGAEGTIVAMVFGSLPDHPPSFFPTPFYFVLRLKPHVLGPFPCWSTYTTTTTLQPSHPQPRPHPKKPSLGDLEATAGTKAQPLECSGES